MAMSRYSSTGHNYLVMAHMVMAYTVMAYIVIAYAVMAYIVMAYSGNESVQFYRP